MCVWAPDGEQRKAALHIESGCGISLSFTIYHLRFMIGHARLVQDGIINRKSSIINAWEGVMEVAELKTMIGDLEARVYNIRDWL